MHTDYNSGRVYYYTYDSLGRVIREFEKTYGEEEYRFGSQFTYDLSNNLTKLVNSADGLAVTTKYYFDAANRPTKSYLNAYVDHQYVYDTLGRLNYTNLNFKNDAQVKIDYTYANAANRSDSEGKITYITSQISKEEIGDRGYEYTYDKVGNITEIKEKTASGNYDTKVTYTYDALGQLKRENNVDLNKTIVYNYDSGGNVVSKVEYPYTTGTVGTATKTVSYGYDSAWKDKLVSIVTGVNSEETTQNITYDEIGNPETYRNGMTFTWQGRQMKTANLNGTAVTYKYNADGLRTYKKVGSTVHEYEYSGDKLFYEKRGDIKFYYRYDVNGNLMSITRLKANGDKFTLYAVCNSRGDVEELRRESGSLYARYVYDSWGNIIAVYDASGVKITDTANLAIQNPFRYRGYYYDTETGFYYVSSRYYDPEIGRFISPDTTEILTATLMGLTDKNLYAYCDNNPVMREDKGGQFWNIIAGAVIGGGLELAGQLLSGKSLSEVNWAKVGVSAVSGGLTAAVGPVAGCLISGATDVAMDALDGNINSVADAAKSFAWGTAKAAVSYGVGTAVGKTTKSLTKVEKVGRLGEDGYPGIKYSYNKGNGRAFRSIELHPNHNNHGIHLQGNKWNPKTGNRGGVFFRWPRRR